MEEFFIENEADSYLILNTVKQGLIDRDPILSKVRNVVKFLKN
jgi:hypothetical protein